MTELEQAGNWWPQAVMRFKSQWMIKSVGTTGGIAAFMWAYFWLLRHPVFPVTVMPLTWVDRLIGFQSWSLVPYASLWIYISLVPGLLNLRREMAPYLSAVALLSLTGFAIFLFWPTAVPRPDVDWAHYPSIQFLKTVDTSGNACPSLHVAFSVMTALWLHRILKQLNAPGLPRLLNVFWCGLIAYSTMATKQHVMVDVETGAILGWVVGTLHLYVLPRFRPLPGVTESS